MAKDFDVTRAWKDEEYRNSLSAEQRAQLPPNPAGAGEISDSDLDSVSGGGEGITPNVGTCGLGSLGCITPECDAEAT